MNVPLRTIKAPPDVFGLFEQLDDLLKGAVQRARAEHGDADAAFRGIYISDQDVDRLLETTAGGRAFGPAELADAAFAHFQGVAALERATDYWGLAAFDHAVLLLALAPELDLRYERIYAYLQDDVTRRRPTVDTALQLLCGNPAERIAARSRFGARAPLRASGLLRLIADQNQIEPPLLSQYLCLEERALAALLGDDTLDPRLAAFCDRQTLAAQRSNLAPEGDVPRRLPHFVSTARRAGRCVRFLFSGPQTSAKREAAQALAASEGVALLATDLQRHHTWKSEPAHLAALLVREAALSGAVLYVSGFDDVQADDTALRSLLEALNAYTGILVLGSPAGLPGVTSDQFLDVPFTPPSAEYRRALWQERTEAAGLEVPNGALASLANHFVLAPEQISEAVDTARLRLEWSVTASGTLTSAEVEGELLAAARGRTGGALRGLTGKLEASYRWKDLVLPADAITHMREICRRVTHSPALLGGETSAHYCRGTGVAVLFAGPSGTGKTMAAAVIANELGLDLFRIDLSAVTSKYIGETEKNLERIFSAASRSNSVLLFDEADALFGKRSEVHDAHDRYANIEISYLLQRMEQYDGVTILTTNQRANLDEAFLRRLSFTVHFPLPGEEQRHTLWQQVWPAGAELHPELDLACLARQFRLSGGNIRNVALAASFLAAAEERPVQLADVLHALRREFEKVGKVVSTAELERMVA
jgi:hypothetical protein